MRIRTLTAAIGVALLTACQSTPAPAEPSPTPTPSAWIAAEPGPACGTIAMDYLGHPLEVYRVITPEPVRGEDVTAWIRQPRDPASRIDAIDLPGHSATYALLLPDSTWLYADPVTPEPCTEPTATPGEPSPSTPVSESPSPSPSPTASAPTPTAAPDPAPEQPTPTASPDPAPEQPTPAPTPEREGGLAKTGVVIP